MIRRFLLVVALSIFITACSSGAEPSPSTKVAVSPPTPIGSPQAATPTAMLALPAPTASPVPSPAPDYAVASPSPVAVASPNAATSPVAAASPAVGASPAAGASPVAIITAPVTAAPPGGIAPGGTTAGTRFMIVQDKSEAQYRARETFANQPGPVDAIGRTNDIDGEIQLEAPGALRGRIVSMRIDLRTLVSDQTRRDNFIRQNTLQTDQFPYAEFRSTEAAGPGVVQPGQEAAFQIPGVMTIKGRERPIVWEARATFDGSVIVGTATARVKLTDFGLEPPRLAILSVEDEMTWQVDLVAEQEP